MGTLRRSLFEGQLARAYERRSFQQQSPIGSFSRQMTPEANGIVDTAPGGDILQQRPSQALSACSPYRTTAAGPLPVWPGYLGTLPPLCRGC